MKFYALLLFTLISYKAMNHQTIPAIKSHINSRTDALQCVSYVHPATPSSLSPAPSHEPTIKPLNNLAIKQSSHQTIEPSNHSTIKAFKTNSSNAKHHARHTPCGWSRIKRLSFIGAPSPLLPALNHPSDSIPPINQLNHSIDSFYAQQTHLELLEFKDSKKGEWLKFLPNIGITYTVSGQPRPSISLSSGLLYQAQKAKQTRAAKRRQIIESNRLEAEREKAKLQELLLRYQLLQEELVNQKSLHQVDEQLFAIRHDEYLRQERAPSDYLQAKRTFLLQQQALQDKEGQLQLLELEILATAHLK